MGNNSEFSFYLELKILASTAGTAESLFEDIVSFLESSGKIKENGALTELKQVLKAPRWHPQVIRRRSFYVPRLQGSGLRNT